MPKSPNRTANLVVRMTLGQRLGYAVAGFGLGWVWSSVISLIWVGALAAGYGGLDRGLSMFKDEWWAHIGFAALFASVVGSWVGSTVGPAVLGPSRYRSPVLASSLLGAGLGAVHGAVLGAVLGWLWGDDSPQSVRSILPLAAGVLVGLVTGWRAGKSLTLAEPIAAPDPARVQPSGDS